jgi:hypothetical protein
MSEHEDDPGLLKHLYDMVLIMYQDWPQLKGTMMKHDAVLEEHTRRIEKVENTTEDTGRHDVATLRETNKRWTDGLWKIALVLVTFLLGAGVMAVVHGAK